MFKTLAIAAAALAVLSVSGCGSLNSAAERVGIETEFVNVYEHADTFTERSYVTIRLYEATLDSALYACDPTVNPDASKTPDEVCFAAADAAEKISPAVQAVSRTIGTYAYLDGKVEQIRADGEIVPAEILQAASEAFYKAQTEWADVEADIQAYIN